MRDRSPRNGGPAHNCSSHVRTIGRRWLADITIASATTRVYFRPSTSRRSCSRRPEYRPARAQPKASGRHSTEIMVLIVSMEGPYLLGISEKRTRSGCLVTCYPAYLRHMSQEEIMSNGTFTIIADGIDAYGDYVNDIRGHVEELESWGLEYEEQDRRLDPTSATLFISITASVLAAPITAVITKVINSLCDRVTLRQSATSRPPLFWHRQSRAMMHPTDAIKRARSLIDEWVLRKPPACI